MKYKILASVCSILLIFSLSGCTNNNEQNLKEKNIEALKFLDTKIFDIANKLNNITLDNYVVTVKDKISGGEQDKAKDSNSEASNDNTESTDNTINITEMSVNTVLLNDTAAIDWDYIRYNIEVMYSACNAIILDLYQLGANNDDVLNLNVNFDNLIIAAKEENKEDCLLNLRKIYELLPKYLASYDASNPTTYRLYTKSHILNAYYCVEINNWSEVLSNLTIAEDYFKNIINNVDFNQNKTGKVNKIYITLKELQNSVAIEDREVFLVKYKILIQELNELT